MKHTIRFHDQTVSVEEAVSRLNRLCLEGLPRRYPEPTPEMKLRLERELEYLSRSTVHLQRLVTLWDLADYATGEEIPVGPGMGALPSLLSAYCLGVTGVDPLAHGLLYERFSLKPPVPPTMSLSVPARAVSQMVTYLEKFYPGVSPSGVIHDDLTLSRIDLALHLIRWQGKRCPDPDAIDFGDQSVYDLFRSPAGRELCAFQTGSPVLTGLRPHSLEELTAAAALEVKSRFDPGFHDFFHVWQERDGERVAGTEPELADTCGLPLYKEQVLLLLRRYAGCSLEEAERRRKDEDLSALPPRLAEEIAGASLTPKSHFAARARLSYQAAYLCRYYPDIYEQAVFALPTPRYERLI